MKKKISMVSFVLALFVLVLLTAFPAFASAGLPKIDPSNVFTAQTDLTVFVDGKMSLELSGNYAWGDKVAIEAPEVPGKTFSFWSGMGGIISYSPKLSLTMYSHMDIEAVYGGAANPASLTAFTSIARIGDSISLCGIAYPATGNVSETGILYSTSEKTLKLLQSNGTKEETDLDKNNCWIHLVTPDDWDTEYFIAAYAVMGGETYYSTVEKVKLKGLKNATSMVANPNSGIPAETTNTQGGGTPGTPSETKDKIKELQEKFKNSNIFGTVTFHPNGGEGAMSPQGYVIGQQFTLSSNAFSNRSGRFKEWNTAQDGSGTVYADGSPGQFDSDNVTLYAQWIPAISYTVTFKVANGSWDDETSEDIVVTLRGYEGDVLKLDEDQIPQVGQKPSDHTYKAGSWDEVPTPEIEIAKATTYTYKYVKKEEATIKKAPTARNLTYNGKAQELVNAGQAIGGMMQYALGSENKATGSYTASIPTGTDAGTYYVWYKAVGEGDYIDSKAQKVAVTIHSNSDGKSNGVRNTSTTIIEPAKSSESSVGPGKNPEKEKDDKVAPSQALADAPASTTQPEAAASADSDEDSRSTDSSITPQQKKKAVLTLNAGLKVKHDGNSMTVKWGTVKGADCYKVYAAYANGKYELVQTVKGSAKNRLAIKKLDGKKLSTTKIIKVYVAAYKNLGKKDVVLARSITGYVAGKKNAKYSNAKKIELSKSSFALKKGKSAKIQAMTVLEYPKKKQLPDEYAKEFRYASADEKIAAVNKAGTITAKKKGTCTIYIYARNGFSEMITVTIK